MVYDECMDAPPLREYMHARLGRGVEVVLESPKLRKHAQSSTSHLEINYFLTALGVRSYIEKPYWRTISSKKSVVGNRRPVSKIGMGNLTFPFGGREITTPSKDVAHHVREENRIGPAVPQTCEASTGFH